MSSTTAPGRPGLLRKPPATPGKLRRRRVKVVWGLLVLNVLTFYAGSAMLAPIPAAAGRVITQSALIVALLVVLSVNRPAAVRPSVYILLLTVLTAEALIASLRSEFFMGAMYRSCRLIGFVAVLWLLTPWWSRRDLLLVKAHLTAVWTVLGSVVLGLLIAPGLARTEGRLYGILWPIPPTQVGHYAAVAIGLTTVLWLSGLLRKEVALVAVVVAVPILLLTHTRTALVALIAGLLMAGLSLFIARSRVRKAFAAGLVVTAVGALTLSTVVTTWLARGQDTEELAQFTGRRKVWDALLAEPRTTFEQLFGFGLSNKSFNGLPIDSNWLATYNDVGLVGASINASMLLFLILAAAFRPRGPERALALFLVAYCIVASFTETGLSDATPYLLELTLAASLLTAPRAARGPT